jgi:hypothetical protein
MAEEEIIKNLEKQVKLTEKELEGKQVGQLKYPLDENSIKAILLSLENRFDLFDLIFENIWRKIFIWTTFFESLDGYEITTPSGGSITINGENLVLTTGSITGNEVRIQKRPLFQGVVTFYRKNAFRTSIMLTSVTNVEGWLTVGNSNLSTPFYGFRIFNNVLRGVSYKGSGSTVEEINLMTISSSIIYHLEARYYPNDKIVFYAKQAESNQNIYNNPVGIITSNLPLTQPIRNNQIMDIRFRTTNANSKSLSISFWQYIQSREYNQ